MSERCLDRKTVQEILPADPVVPVADERNETTESFLFAPSTLLLGPKSEQRRREALWDLFQSECAFLYDHLMVLKNVSLAREMRSESKRLTPFFCVPARSIWTH